MLWLLAELQATGDLLQSTAAELRADVTALADKTAQEAAALQAKIADEVEVSIATMGSRLQSTEAELGTSIATAQEMLTQRLDQEAASLSATMISGFAADRADASQVRTSGAREESPHSSPPPKSFPNMQLF
eukprot:SAG22_NODE_2378_length_2634_cov_1.447337_1_plen_132_part_00